MVLLKAEDDHVGHLLVKTEPKQEPVESSASYTSSLADLDGITDLLPIQTGPLHRVHIFTRDETGLVCLPTQLERTLQLYW